MVRELLGAHEPFEHWVIEAVHRDRALIHHLLECKGVSLMRVLHVAIRLNRLLQEMTLTGRRVHIAVKCAAHQTAFLALGTPGLFKAAHHALLPCRVLLSLLLLTFVCVH